LARRSSRGRSFDPAAEAEAGMGPDSRALEEIRKRCLETCRTVSKVPNEGDGNFTSAGGAGAVPMCSMGSMGNMGNMGPMMIPMNPMMMGAMNPMAMMGMMNPMAMMSMMNPMAMCQMNENMNMGMSDGTEQQGRTDDQAFSNFSMMGSGPTMGYRDDSGEKAFSNFSMMGPGPTMGYRDESGEKVPRSNHLHPAYLPAEAEQIPGITDRRWEGLLKSFHHEMGYGFIQCLELNKHYPDNDVFIHRNQKRHFEQNDTINFAVFINHRGKPQATDLRRPQEEED